MLQKVSFLPGFNKQVTATGAEGQWTGGDMVRFRYGTPEKIGGWDQLGEDKLTGAARALHHFDDNAGINTLRLVLTEFYTSIQADNIMTFTPLIIRLVAVIFLQRIPKKPLR